MVLWKEIKTVQFMGAGEIDENKGSSDWLQHAELKILGPKQCLEEFFGDEVSRGYLL